MFYQTRPNKIPDTWLILIRASMFFCESLCDVSIKILQNRVLDLSSVSLVVSFLSASTVSALVPFD